MALTQAEVDEGSTKPKLKDLFKETDGGRQRFLLELEFVHCLANPTYIHYLAQNRYFEDDAFVGYLKYLQYWQQPEYTKFIMYPHALFFLEQLQSPQFRTAMAHPSNKELAHRQQFYYWKHYRNNRLKHILPRNLPEETFALPPPAVAPTPPPPVAVAVAAQPVKGPIQSVAPVPVQVKVENSARVNAGERRKRKYSTS